MLRYKNLILIGTSHIAIQSVRDVTTVITNEKPDVVALELDKARFHALFHPQTRALPLRAITQFGIKGYLFARLGHYVEHKLGSIVGVAPGSEMRTAAETAQHVGAHLALIDQPIETTLKRFSQRLTWKEKFRFVTDLLFGVFKKNTIAFDPRTVPDTATINKLLSDVKKKYPNVHHTLVVERNRYMAKRLHRLMENHTLIVGVIGAGHEVAIIDEIKTLETLRT